MQASHSATTITGWSLQPVDGKVPYEELLALCEPDKMTFEMDCGWVKVAGQDPVALMKKYPQRFSMFHVKDFHLPAEHLVCDA